MLIQHEVGLTASNCEKEQYVKERSGYNLPP